MLILPPLALNGARTIELWFKLDSTFHESSTSAQTLIARNTTWCNSCDEGQLLLIGTPLDLNNTGQLRFGWQDANGNNPQIVFSNTSYWHANKWYHVAGVIDTLNGMRLYVNGKQQSETLVSQTNAVTQSDTSTYIGKWGTSLMSPRYFRGKIENVRISSIARYNANFIPDCLNETVDSAVPGMWFFNHASGFAAYDSSGNQYDGDIYNVVWSSDTFCLPLNPHDNPSGIFEVSIQSDLKIYPNPSTEGIIRINAEAITDVFIYDIIGTLQHTSQSMTMGESIDVSHLNSGTYLIKAFFSDGNSKKSILILQ